MKSARNLIVMVLSMVLIICSGSAMGTEVPTVLNYQGILTDNIGDPVTGPQEITFSLYSVPVAGIPFWSNTETVTLDLTGHFSVTIGDSSPVDSVAYEQNFNGETYIGITVGTNPELMPRQKFTSVAYSVKAGNGIPTGGIIMWSGAIVDIPSGWALCDGTNGTPDLLDRFVLGAGNRFIPDEKGGEETHVLTVEEMPSHAHAGPDHRHTVDPPNINTSSRSLTGSMSFHGSDDGSPVHSVNGVFSGTRHDNEYRRGDDLGGSYSYPQVNIDVSHSHTADIPQFYSGNSGTGNTENAGLGAAHNTMPPYYALAFIMKL